MPARHNANVMRFSAATIIASATFAGCAINPQQLCAPAVPSTWQYVGRDKELTNLLESNLPVAPYTTNEGRTVRSVQHVWFRGNEQQLLACTLARGARDNCSVRTTAFQRDDNTWVKGREDAVLCKVIVSTHNTSRELKRGP